MWWSPLPGGVYVERMGRIEWMGDGTAEGCLSRPSASRSPRGSPNVRGNSQTGDHPLPEALRSQGGLRGSRLTKHRSILLQHISQVPIEHH
jgi:hypothetical protein